MLQAQLIELFQAADYSGIPEATSAHIGQSARVGAGERYLMVYLDETEARPAVLIHIFQAGHVEVEVYGNKAGKQGRRRYQCDRGIGTATRYVRRLLELNARPAKRRI